MPSSIQRTSLLLKEAYANLKKSIQDPFPEVNELLSNPRDPNGKPRHTYGQYLHGKFKEWIDELQGVQSELIECLDRDFEESENEEERDEMEYGI